MTAPDIIKQLVERFDQHRDYAESQEAGRLTREAESVDKSIDGLVYELYGLSEDDIKIVENKQ